MTCIAGFFTHPDVIRDHLLDGERQVGVRFEEDERMTEPVVAIDGTVRSRSLSIVGARVSIGERRVRHRPSNLSK